MTPEAEAAHREPRTEAGRRLFNETWTYEAEHEREASRLAILAIEREAAYRDSLSEHGFAANRPTGPRTRDGHGLAVALRKRDAEVDWDAWIRTVEDQAAALAATPDTAREPLDADVERYTEYLLAAIDADDRANIHGWSVALRAARAATSEGTA